MAQQKIDKSKNPVLICTEADQACVIIGRPSRIVVASDLDQYEAAALINHCGDLINRLKDNWHMRFEDYVFRAICRSGSERVDLKTIRTDLSTPIDPDALEDPAAEYALKHYRNPEGKLADDVVMQAIEYAIEGLFNYEVIERIDPDAEEVSLTRLGKVVKELATGWDRLIVV